METFEERGPRPHLCGAKPTSGGGGADNAELWALPVFGGLSKESTGQ